MPMRAARTANASAIDIRPGLAGLLLMCCAEGAMAQGRSSSSIIPPDRADQNPAPRTASPAQAPAPAPEAASALPAIPPFALSRVTVEGSSLPPADLAVAWQPFVGQTIDGPRLKALVDSVAATYGRSPLAFYTVYVPAQTPTDGVLKLLAIEGYVQRGVVRGVKGKMRALVGRYLERIVREKPLTKATLQRYATFIREVPGLYADISFEPGDRPAAVRLVVAAKPKPVQVAFGLNNRGTALLGKTQGEADGFVNSLLVGGDQLRLVYARPIRAPYYQSLSVAYALPLDADGLSFQVNAGKLKTRPRLIPLQGNATSLGGQLSYAAIRNFRTSLNLSAGLDGVDSDNAFLGFTFSNERTRALRLSASYSLSEARRQLSASISASAGLKAFDARVLDRDLSESRFRKLNLRVSANQQIGRDLILRVNGAAQLSGDRLPGTEQIALGGDDFGRAYETAIISGDRGYAGSGEIAFRPATGLPKQITGSEAYAFVDAGRVRYHGRFGFPGSRSHLASAGGGVRLAVASRLVLQVEATRGFNSPVFYDDHKRWRLRFNVRSIF